MQNFKEKKQQMTGLTFGQLSWLPPAKMQIF